MDEVRIYTGDDYIILNKKYGFQSLTMNEIANRLMINSTENKDFS